VSIARRAAIALIASLALLSCSSEAPEAPPASRQPATTLATVITLRSVTRPDARVRRHDLLIANGRVRSTDEVDRWRLFDVGAKTVTTVDDVARTFETRSLATILDEKTRQIETAPRVPAEATVHADEGVETIDGYPSRHVVVEMGPFERDLWITDALPIDPGFFALYSLAEPLDPNGIRSMRSVLDALGKMRGFPAVDRIRLDMGDRTVEIETRVESVGRKAIPIDWLRIPADYRDLDVNAPPGEPPTTTSHASGRRESGAGSPDPSAK